MASRRPFEIGASAALLLLASCQQGADVAVEQAGGAATVLVTRDGKPACIDQLNVYAGEPTGGPPAWFIIATKAAPCTHRVTLGQTPPGFEMAAPAAFATTAGTSYLVEITGKSYIGATRFTATGRLRQPPPTQNHRARTPASVHDSGDRRT